MKKILALIVMGVAIGAGVSWSGGFERAWSNLRDVLQQQSYFAPAPRPSPATPTSTPPARPKAAKKDVIEKPKSNQQVTPPRIVRAPDGPPRERLNDADRERLNRIIDARLGTSTTTVPKAVATD